MNRKASGKTNGETRPLTNDEKRFQIWERIFAFQRGGSTVSEIAETTGQTYETVREVLHGTALNRLRKITV